MKALATKHSELHSDSLDQERAASMADEGGCSGALMEVHHLTGVTQKAFPSKSLLISLGLGALMGVGGYFAWRSFRKPSAAREWMGSDSIDLG